ncbi:MAG: hypothetical protein U0528_02965 [Anaerolineae bacterium]
MNRLYSQITNTTSAFARAAIVVLSLFSVLSSSRIVINGQEPNWVTGIAWSKNDQIAIGTYNGTIHILDMQGNKLNTIENGSVIYSLKFDPSGSKLAVADATSFVKIWNVSNGQLLLSAEGALEHRDIVWSPDGTKLGGVGSAGGSLNRNNTFVWNASNGQVVTSTDFGSDSLDWSPDGTMIALATYSGVQIRAADTLHLIREIATDLPFNYVSWSPDSTKLAMAVFTQTHKIVVVDAFTGELLYELSGHTDLINSVLWDPDGINLASGSSDGTIRIWSANSGQLINIVQTSTRVLSLALSPDGTQIAFGEPDGILRVIDLNSSAIPTTVLP